MGDRYSKTKKELIDEKCEEVKRTFKLGRTNATYRIAKRNFQEQKQNIRGINSENSNTLPENEKKDDSSKVYFEKLHNGDDLKNVLDEETNILNSIQYIQLA